MRNDRCGCCSRSRHFADTWILLKPHWRALLLECLRVNVESIGPNMKLGLLVPQTELLTAAPPSDQTNAFQSLMSPRD